jgi:hypothetical protein
MYALFGFDPLPFRTACFGLPGLNLRIAYRLVMRIAGGTTATITLAFICCYAALMDLYWSTGAVCDLITALSAGTRTTQKARLAGAGGCILHVRPGSGREGDRSAAAGRAAADGAAGIRSEWMLAAT